MQLSGCHSVATPLAPNRSAAIRQSDLPASHTRGVAISMHSRIPGMDDSAWPRPDNPGSAAAPCHGNTTAWAGTNGLFTSSALGRSGRSPLLLLRDQHDRPVESDRQHVLVVGDRDEGPAVAVRRFGCGRGVVTVAVGGRRAAFSDGRRLDALDRSGTVRWIGGRRLRFGSRLGIGRGLDRRCLRCGNVTGLLLVDPPRVEGREIPEASRRALLRASPRSG